MKTTTTTKVLSAEGLLEEKSFQLVHVTGVTCCTPDQTIPRVKPASIGYSIRRVYYGLCHFIPMPFQTPRPTPLYIPIKLF